MGTTQKRVKLVVRKAGKKVWEIDVWPEDWAAPSATVSVHALADAAELAVAFRSLGHEVQVLRVMEENRGWQNDAWIDAP